MNSPDYVDALRASDADVESVIDILNRRDDAAQGGSREHPRVAYRVTGGILLELNPPHGHQARLRVRPCNLSAAGVNVVHGGFVHAHTPCSIILAARDGEPVRVSGNIARCSHVTGRIHEIGILFDSEITLSEFVTTATGDDASATDAVSGPALAADAQPPAGASGASGAYDANAVREAAEAIVKLASVKVPLPVIRTAAMRLSALLR